jgi:SAM-dependent methyltransferase
MAAKHLFVASDVGIFERLADNPSTIQELAENTGLSQSSTRILADAMVVLGFLEKQDGVYRNSAEAASFLAGRTPADLRPALRLFDRVAYPNWSNLEKAIRSKQSSHFGELSEEQQKVFSQGVEALTAGAANALASAYEFERHMRVLDIGGGTGSFLLPLVRRHAHLKECALFELPDTARVAKARLAIDDLGNKVKVIEGDFMKGQIPAGYDVLILANVVHILSPDHNVDLMSKIRKSCKTGDRLLLVDFWTDSTHTKPAIAALFAGEFLVMSGEGDVYSVDDAKKWFAKTGWKFVDYKQLAGPQSLVVAEATA